MEYRDIHDSKKRAEKNLEGINRSSMSKEQKEMILKFIEDLKIGKAGKKVKERRIGNYLLFLLRIHEVVKKDINKMTEKELTDFYKDLQEDKIKKMNGTPYSLSSKDEFTKTIKRYLGWAWGKDSKDYSKKVRWMKENDVKKTNKRAITLEEAQLIIDSEKNPRNKCLFMFLFDSGARIEEALNVRISDLMKSEKKDSGYFLVHLRGQKTEEADRTISVPLSTKYINEWLKIHPNKKEDSFLLFPIEYDNARKIIKEMSEALKQFKENPIKPHELRHSSATHYIQHGGFGAENVGGFYYRYGWRFGSDEALRYIKMHLYGGEIGQDKVVKHIVNDKVENLQSELENLRMMVEQMKKYIEYEEVEEKRPYSDIPLKKK